MVWSAEGVKLDRDLVEIFQNSFLAAHAKWYQRTAVLSEHGPGMRHAIMAKLGHDLILL